MQKHSFLASSTIDRKVLAELAVNDAEAFKHIVDQAKTAANS